MIQIGEKRDIQIQEAAIERAKNFDIHVKAKYSIWRREYESPNSDSTVKLMRDQIIMAKAYASIAKAKNATGIYDSLIKHSKRSQQAIGEATYDSELNPRYFSIYYFTLIKTFKRISPFFLFGFCCVDQCS